MTELLEKAVAQARRLPDDKQDAVAALLLKTVSDLTNDLTQEAPPLKERQPGSAQHLLIYMAEDFDAPLEDFKDYM